jgi:hypothetical protein
MVKIPIIFLLSIFCFSCLGQVKKIVSKNDLIIRNILDSYKKIQIFERKNEEVNSGNYEDSINKYNYVFSNLLLSPQFRKLGNVDLKETAEKSGLKITTSKDKKLKVVSWQVFEFSPTPMCSNLMLFDNKSQIISLNGTSEKDFGENIQNDTIIDLRIKNKPYYILIGSNKCGSLCIQELASLYSIVDGKLIKCSKAFFDGNRYSDDIEFDYLINENLKNEPSFKIDKLELISPVFNDSKTEIIGTKKYQISSSLKKAIRNS